MDNKPYLTIDQQNDSTLLHWAAEYNRTDLLVPLVLAGATVNDETKTGITPLHSAVKGYHKASMKILVEMGADPHTPDPYVSSVMCQILYDAKYFSFFSDTGVFVH